MKAKYMRKPLQQEIAAERIKKLFEHAKLAFAKDSSLADRYVKLAKTMSMKYKVRIPSNLKRQFCKHCFSYLKPGVNCRVRTNKGKVVYYCLKCKHYMRIPYNNKKIKQKFK